MQGSQRDALMIDATGVRGDRAWDLVDAPSGNLASARRYAAPLMASATNDAITLPDGMVAHQWRTRL
jgi:uncharacterized protein YcbX